jgi:hypothetical protein
MYCTTVRIRPEVLVTHTKELGQIITAVHDTSTNLGRTASIPTAIAIAQLALKHRQNKNSRQRVIVFVGSPLEDASPDAERALVRLAKKLKKNNVALDVIAFGDGIEETGEGGHSIFRAFVESVSAESPEAIREHRSIAQESDSENELQTVDNFSCNLEFTGPIARA